MLTCFISYSFAGLMNQGLGPEGIAWTTQRVMPENGEDLWSSDSGRIVWEVVFFIVSMFVVSIITGIICDTFGELRTQQDDSADYRLNTNFVRRFD